MHRKSKIKILQIYLSLFQASGFMYTKREDNHLTNLPIIEEKLTKKINKYIFFPWFVIYNQILFNNLEISPPYFFKVFINKKDN